MKGQLLDDYLTSEEQPIYSNPTIADRIVVMFLDYLFLILLATPVAFIAVGVEDGDISPLVMGIMMAVFLLKDLFGGQSFAKSMRGMRVVDIKTGARPRAFQLVFRNILFGVWVFDLIPLLANPSRRLGDILVRTQVVKMKEDKPTWKTWLVQAKGYNIGDLILSLVFTVAYGIVVYKVLSKLEELASAAGV
ncbi:MAG: RDD family protein [Aureispira sp.]|nr:RDD family protein [Aureispira sp.]